MDKFARRLNESPKKEDARGSTVVSDRASVMFAIVNESRKCEGYDYRDPEPDQIKIHVMKNRSGGTGMAFKDIFFDKKTLIFYEQPVDNLVAMAMKI
jgi:replicative DNA helicase